MEQQWSRGPASGPRHRATGKPAPERYPGMPGPYILIRLQRLPPASGRPIRYGGSGRECSRELLIVLLQRLFAASRHVCTSPYCTAFPCFLASTGGRSIFHRAGIFQPGLLRRREGRRRGRRQACLEAQRRVRRKCWPCCGSRAARWGVEQKGCRIGCSGGRNTHQQIPGSWRCRPRGPTNSL